MTWEMPIIVGAYFLGAVPFGFIIVRIVRGVDIRTLGSGNIGATNVWRVLGRGWGLLAFGLDVLKGFAPACAGNFIGGPELGALAGLAAIIGHNWPIFLQFRGGKGVATSCGVFLAIFPSGLVVSFGVWMLALAIWRYVSVASMLGGIALLVSALLLQDEPFGAGRFLTAFAALVAVLSIIRHRSNIKRLLQGSEVKVGKQKDRT